MLKIGKIFPISQTIALIKFFEIFFYFSIKMIKKNENLAKSLRFFTNF